MESRVKRVDTSVVFEPNDHGYEKFDKDCKVNYEERTTEVYDRFLDDCQVRPYDRERQRSSFLIYRWSQSYKNFLVSCIKLPIVLRTVHHLKVIYKSLPVFLSSFLLPLLSFYLPFIFPLWLTSYDKKRRYIFKTKDGFIIFDCKTLRNKVYNKIHEIG